ncbi:MAG: ATP-binding cassette domain-containing protein [Betaproteobacteria bacterium]|nr:MAG: ATP-binding cassette domain-containing protein [Betaproteobacteria bacterium]
MPAPHLLEVAKLSHCYDSLGARGRRIEFPDFTLDAGAMLLLRGASGSGKSTLLQRLAGARTSSADVFDSTRITLRGQNILALSQAQRDALRPTTIGWIPQRVHLLNSLNVIDNIVLPIALSAGSKAMLRQRALELLERAGLSALVSAKSTELSVGQAARCCVIRALIAQPKLLLADEPSAALDSQSAQAIAQLLCDFCSAGGGLIVATHDEPFQQQLRSHCATAPADIELSTA